uniref:Uncharacterized protein n=1 Tax=Kalanchoe fedtschenkoi TaxID=63787 RepID=A0A7N1A9V3_KALFE
MILAVYKMLQLCLDHLDIFFLSFPFPSFDSHAFRQPDQQSEGLVAGSLNLVTMPLKFRLKDMRTLSLAWCRNGLTNKLRFKGLPK